MIEMIQTQAREINHCPLSQPAWEVQQFMRNLFEAAKTGDLEEVATYFADEMEPFQFPLGAQCNDETTILVDDQMATFSCSLVVDGNKEMRFKSVLDKSEGYWQIIHTEMEKIDRTLSFC